MTKIIIAIDGYSACGKSTTARAVAKKLGYLYVDSGAMYRAVTFKFLQDEIDISDKDKVLTSLSQIHLNFELENGLPVTYLNGNQVEAEIRQMNVSENVSAVAAIPAVRRAMVRIQQEMGNVKGIVMDGRDIGTVVFPDAELKIFMTADPKIRAERRLKELEQNGIESSLDNVRANLEERDLMDTTREDSPLSKAEDAVILDNSHLTFVEQVDEIVRLAKKKLG